MSKPYEIKLDLYSRNLVNHGCIEYVQYDNNAYPLTVQLTEYGRPYRIPDEIVVEFNFEMPSGRHMPCTGRVLESKCKKRAVFDVPRED